MTDIAICAAQTTFGQRIQMWCRDVLTTLETDIMITQVICYDDEDIGSFLACGKNTTTRNNAKRDQQNGNDPNNGKGTISHEGCLAFPASASEKCLIAISPPRADLAGKRLQPEE